MGKIPKKTLEDLEYYEVLRQCADFAITPLGKQACLSLQPKTAIKELLEDLKAVSEYHASFDNENRIPNHGFEPLISIFSLLSVKIVYWIFQYLELLQLILKSQILY